MVPLITIHNKDRGSSQTVSKILNIIMLGMRICKTHQDTLENQAFPGVHTQSGYIINA